MMQTEKIEAGPRLPRGLSAYDNDRDTRTAFAAWARAMFGVEIEWATRQVPDSPSVQWLALVTCSDHVFSALSDLGKGWRTVRVAAPVVPVLSAPRVADDPAFTRYAADQVRAPYCARCGASRLDALAFERGCDPPWTNIAHTWTDALPAVRVPSCRTLRD